MVEDTFKEQQPPVKGKPKFDPNKPFVEVKQKKPSFDPNKPFEQISEPAKKKEEPTPSISSDGQLPAKNKTNNQVIVGEIETITAPVEKDPVQLAQEADVLGKKGEATTAGNIDVFVPDEESVKKSNKIKEKLKKDGFDADKLNRDFTGIPEEVYNVQGFSKPELLQQYKDNPQHYERMIATAKWQSDLHDQLKSQEGGEQAWHDLQSNMNNVHVGDYTQQRENLKRILDTVDKFGGDKREQIIKNLGIDFTNLYGKEAGDVEALSHDERYKRGDINSNQLAATHYLEDIHPEELRKYQAAFLKDEDIKDNLKAQLGKQEAAKKLDELGIQLRKSYLNEKFNPINKEYQSLVDKASKEGLTPEEQQRAQELEIQGKPLFDQLQQANSDEQQIPDKYPMASYLDTKNFAQELIGQQNTGIERFLTKTGEAFKNTGAGVYDFAAEPFRSKQEDEIRQAEILGSGKIDETISYLKQGNQINQSFKPELSKELQADVDNIKRDNSLSEPEKLQATTKLLMSRMGEWQRTPQMKTNIGLKSLMYGIGDMAAGLVPFMGIEMLTGGGATAGLARKLTSSFVSASATGFEEAYRDGLERGETNPYAYATRVTAITAAAIAGAQTAAAIRKMFAGEKTAIGNLVSKMTGAEIDAALKESPKALKTFGKSLSAVKDKAIQGAKAFGSSTVSGFKDAAKINAFMTGGKIANDAISGDLKSVNDYGKDFMIETLKFALPSAAIGGISKTLKPTDLSKSALYESAVNPDGILSSLEQKLKDGTIAPEEGLQVKRNVETVSKIYQKNSPFFKSLDDKAKREYLYNALTEVRAKEAAQGLPERQAEKFEMQAEIAKHKNGLIIEPKTPEQLTKRKEQLEKSLIPEKDAEGKNIEIPEKEIFAVKAEIEAINQVLDESKKIEVPQAPTVKGEPENISQPIELSVNNESAKSNEEGTQQSVASNEPVTTEEKSQPDENVNIQRAKEIANSGEIKGFSAAPLKEAANNNPEEFNSFLQNIAEQSQDPKSKTEAIKAYGQELVDIANELHPPKEPVLPTGATGEGDGSIGITHAQTAEIRNEHGFDEYVKDPKTFEQWDVEAKERIKKGELPSLIKKMEAGHEISPVEQRMMGFHIANLDEAVSKDPSNENIAALKKAVELSDIVGGRQAGQSLVARRGTFLPDDTLGGAFVREMEAEQVNELTPEQKAKITKEYEDIKTANEALQQKVAQLEAEKAKRDAETEVKAKKSTTPKTKKTHEDFAKERKDIADKLKDKLKKARTDTNVTIVPYAKELIAIAPEVAKLVKSYVEEGVSKLEDVVKKIHSDLKEHIPDITEKDVHDLIAGNYNEKKKTKSEIAIQIFDLKTQAQLITKLDAILKGEEPKNERAKIKRNQEVESLRKQIKDIEGFDKEVANSIDAKASLAAKQAKGTEKDLGKAEKEIDTADAKEKKRVELEKERELKKQQIEAERERKQQLAQAEKERKSLEREFEKEKREEERNKIKAELDKKKELERRLSYKTPAEYYLDKRKEGIKKQISDLEEQLRTGRFEKHKTEIKLDKEGEALKDKVIKLRQERELRILKLQYAARSKYEKAKQNALEVLNVPRTIMSSMDFSAPLRQGLWAGISHPRTATLAGVEMFKQAFSQKRFDRWFHDLREMPRFKTMEKSELYVSDPHDPKLSAKEEAFMNNLAEKIPVVGKFIKGSERAYVSFLNKMRVDLFNRFADRFEEQGRTVDNSPELYKKTADYINNSTGRGKLGPLEDYAPVFNTLFFSPRLMASRINLLTNPINPNFYRKVPKEIRIMYAKDLFKFLALGTSILTLASLNNDNKVELDPRSSDFGKIRNKNTRWDIWGGFQPYVRLAAQLVTGERKSSNTGKVQELDGKGAFGTDKGDVSMSFLRGKLSPVPSMIVDFMKGKDAVGQPISMGSEAESHLLPLLYSDLKEAVKDRGVSALFTVGLPSVFGVGVNTYSQTEKKSGRR